MTNPQLRPSIPNLTGNKWVCGVMLLATFLNYMDPAGSWHDHSPRIEALTTTFLRGSTGIGANRGSVSGVRLCSWVDPVPDCSPTGSGPRAAPTRSYSPGWSIAGDRHRIRDTPRSDRVPPATRRRTRCRHLPLAAILAADTWTLAKPATGRVPSLRPGRSSRDCDRPLGNARILQSGAAFRVDLDSALRGTRRRPRRRAGQITFWSNRRVAGLLWVPRAGLACQSSGPAIWPTERHCEMANRGRSRCLELDEAGVPSRHRRRCQPILEGRLAVSSCLESLSPP